MPHLLVANDLEGGALIRLLPSLKAHIGADLCAEDADRAFDHVMAWARYAGFVSYDSKTEQVALT